MWSQALLAVSSLMALSCISVTNTQIQEKYTTINWEEQETTQASDYLSYTETVLNVVPDSRTFITEPNKTATLISEESLDNASGNSINQLKNEDTKAIARFESSNAEPRTTTTSKYKTRQPAIVSYRNRPVEVKASKMEASTELSAANARYDGNTGVLLGEGHPCHRECKLGEEPMICYYHFEIEWYQTMSKACYDCPYNETDCFRPDCIPADGMNRPITVINRKMPGPAVEVCQNDRIIVDVTNDMMVEGTTIHWHGQHQRGTPYMDGTPFITQCPILPESTFRYQFNATHAGTHFWHSHAGMQRADGAAGSLVVRRPRPLEHHADLYDYDRSEHTMIITDWVHELSISSFTDHHHSSGDNKPPTLLVNGLGRFAIFNRTDRPLFMKAARFNVEQGYRYRFRVINAEFLNCPIELSVDNHNITLISSDGYDLEPVTATSLVTYAGERFDFVLEATADIDNYWLRFRGLMDCDERFTKAKQVAVLHYEGALEQEPAGELTWEESHNEGLQINALNKGTEENETISIAELRSVDIDDDSLKEVADYQFYVSYDFYPKNNSHFHKSPYYGYYQVPEPHNRLYTPQLNHISMKVPSSPLLITRPSSDNFCNSSSVGSHCKKDYCECHHVLSVKSGSVVEIIMVDEGVTFDANHPFHLHGHSFRVVALRKLSANTSIEAVKEFDRAGLLHRNLKNAPIKDTVTVPDGGFTVVRFKADNPGYWLFHCHIEFHAEVGMALVFKVGENEEMAPVPPNFPMCGDYTPDNMLELATESKPKDPGPHISINHFWPVVYVNSTSGATAKGPGLALATTLGVLLNSTPAVTNKPWDHPLRPSYTELGNMRSPYKHTGSFQTLFDPSNYLQVSEGPDGFPQDGYGLKSPRRDARVITYGYPLSKRLPITNVESDTVSNASHSQTALSGHSVKMG